MRNQLGTAVLARYIVILLLAQTTQGCAAGPAPTQFVELGEAEGSVWLSAAEVQHFRCGAGLVLVCDHTIAKLSDRLCRCLR